MRSGVVQVAYDTFRGARSQLISEEMQVNRTWKNERDGDLRSRLLSPNMDLATPLPRDFFVSGILQRVSAAWRRLQPRTIDQAQPYC